VTLSIHDIQFERHLTYQYSAIMLSVIMHGVKFYLLR